MSVLRPLAAVWQLLCISLFRFSGICRCTFSRCHFLAFFVQICISMCVHVYCIFSRIPHAWFSISTQLYACGLIVCETKCWKTLNAFCCCCYDCCLCWLIKFTTFWLLAHCWVFLAALHPQARIGTFLCLLIDSWVR